MKPNQHIQFNKNKIKIINRNIKDLKKCKSDGYLTDIGILKLQKKTIIKHLRYFYNYKYRCIPLIILSVLMGFVMLSVIVISILTVFQFNFN